ncbi:MAG: AraC family transcriptional regulator [Gammaproteobacteria bacterium]|nr:MAG: AraC family transcriptional regulator [Gammaproteobacteria bacterium]
MLCVSNKIVEANQDGSNRDKFEVMIASVDGQPIHCQNNTVFTPHCTIDDIDDADIILIPAISEIEKTLKTEHKLVDWLVKKHQQGIIIGSACTGAFLLAETGLLDGKLATTHFSAVNDFKHRYPKVKMKPEHMVTDEGNLLCSGGASSCEDLALYLIEKYINRKVAVKSAKMFVRDYRRISQAPYFEFEGNTKHTDTQILLCQRWLENNHSNNIEIKNLSSIASMSQRTFERRFKKATGYTPLLYLQKLRVTNAKKLLETTDQSFDAIACSVGYKNCGAFRKVFVRDTNLLPSEYRNKFNAKQAGEIVRA